MTMATKQHQKKLVRSASDAREEMNGGVEHKEGLTHASSKRSFSFGHNFLLLPKSDIMSLKI